MTARCTARVRIVAAAIVAIVTGSSCRKEPPSQLLSAQRACATCNLVLEPVVTLRDPATLEELPDRMIYVAPGPSSHVVAVGRDATSLLVFDLTGLLVRRLGAEGDGPGEFRRIRRILALHGKSLVVTDWGTGRVTVLGGSYEVTRISSMQRLPDLVLRDGTMLLADHVFTPDRIGFPLHVIDSAGEVVRSFGTDLPEYAPDARLATTRLVASDSTGGIWSVAPGRYLLERWDPMTGTRTDSFEITSPHVTPVRRWPADERLRPPGIVEWLWAGSDGRLYLLLRVADSAWTPPSNANVERRLTAEDYDLLYDWILEVVDPTARAVIASHRVSTALWGRTGSPFLAGRDPDGGEAIVVYRPDLSYSRGEK